MKKSEMVCSNCIKFDGTLCRLNPHPSMLATVESPPFGGKLVELDPATHWCANGEWHDGMDTIFDSIGNPIYWTKAKMWGDWEVNEKGESL